MQISTPFSLPISIPADLSNKESPMVSSHQRKPQRVSVITGESAISKLRKDFLGLTLPANNFASNDQTSQMDSPKFPTVELVDAVAQLYLSAYQAVEAFLDKSDLIIVQPKDETKYRAFPKVLSRSDSISPGSTNSSLYVSSPLLKNVGGSSLLARRTLSQNTSPIQRMELTQNYSVPSKLSPFCAKLQKDSISTNTSEEMKIERDLFSSPDSPKDLCGNQNLSFIPSAKCLFEALSEDAPARSSLDSPSLKKEC